MTAQVSLWTMPEAYPACTAWVGKQAFLARRRGGTGGLTQAAGLVKDAPVAFLTRALQATGHGPDTEEGTP